MTQEQNTATSAEEYFENFMQDHDAGILSTRDVHLRAREYANLRIRELSEKGEPSDEDRDLCAQHYVEHNRFAHIGAAYCSGWIDLHGRLAPVSAALRAENKEMKKHISTCESDHVNIDELLSEFDRRGINTFDWDGDEGAESAIVDGVERYVQTKDEEIASLRAQLETAEKALSFYAQKKYQAPLYGHIARDVIDTILKSKGGKAHE